MTGPTADDGRTGPTARAIVVLGDVMTDVVAQVSDPLALGSDTPAQVRTAQGGAGANVAHWLAALGLPVLFAGRVGDDPFGREAVQVLHDAGVRTDIQVDPHRPTGTVVVLVGADGERTMLPDAGANSALDRQQLPLRRLPGAGWLHVSGYTVLNPGSRDAGLAALAAARDTGVPRSVDAASATPLEALGGKEFLRLTAACDLVFCTLDEAEVLVGTRDPDIALARLTAHYREVVLKLGAAGAQWLRDGRPGVRVPAAVPPAPPVDSTGAGDAFAAGYLAGRVRGDPPEQTLTRACRTAAQTVSTVGARPRHRPHSVSPGNRP